MSIKEFLDNLPAMKSPDGKTLRETMAEQMPIWSNNACAGYAIAALQDSGFSRDEIKRIISCLNAEFHDFTVDQAEKLYIDY